MDPRLRGDAVLRTRIFPLLKSPIPIILTTMNRKCVLRLTLVLCLLISTRGSYCFSESDAPAVDPQWTAFSAMLTRMVMRQPGIVGIFLKDLRKGFEYDYNVDRLFPSASLIKLPVMVATFEAIKEGRISLGDTIRMHRRDKRGGSGELKFYRSGSRFTVSDLLNHMIMESDNTATHLLVSLLGFDYLNATFESLGLKDTRIHPEGLSLADGRVRHENYTSPREMAYLLEKIYHRELVSTEASAQMIEILKRAQYRDRLARYLPPEWQMAHKTGLLRRACHDCGVVYSPEGDFLVCVLTARNRNYRRAKRFIASVGRRTFNFYSTQKA